MIEVEVSGEILEKAGDLYDAFRKDRAYIPNSIKKGEGAYEGFIGELAALTYLGVGFIHANTYNYDIIKTAANDTIDVKTGKCKSIPKPHYTGSVADTSLHQSCKFLLFTRALAPAYRKVWLMGYISKSDFIEQAEFHKKGTYDYTNNYKVSADCYKIRYDQLISCSELKHANI